MDRHHRQLFVSRTRIPYCRTEGRPCCGLVDWGLVGLTYGEFGIRQLEPTLYWIMFASVFLINLMFATDVNRSYQARSQVPAG